MLITHKYGATFRTPEGPSNSKALTAGGQRPPQPEVGFGALWKSPITCKLPPPSPPNVVLGEDCLLLLRRGLGSSGSLDQPSNLEHSSGQRVRARPRGTLGPGQKRPIGQRCALAGREHSRWGSLAGGARPPPTPTACATPKKGSGSSRLTLAGCEPPSAKPTTTLHPKSCLSWSHPTAPRETGGSGLRTSGNGRARSSRLEGDTTVPGLSYP